MYTKLKQDMKDAGFPVSEGTAYLHHDNVLARDFFHFNGGKLEDYLDAEEDTKEPTAEGGADEAPTEPSTEGAEAAGGTEEPTEPATEGEGEEAAEGGAGEGTEEPTEPATEGEESTEGGEEPEEPADEGEESTEGEEPVANEGDENA